MEAKQNSLAKFMQQQDAQFFIPVYQRNYDWKNEQCKQLFNDICKVGLDSKIHSHFIGSIVYIQLNPIASSPILTIIDGQQRLTTLTLLIAALVQKANLLGKSKLADELSRRYLLNEFMDDDEKLKLKPIKKDNLALKFILNLSSTEISEFSRIIENFNFFYDTVNEENLEIIKTGIQKLIFIEIALDKDKDDPQKIFQSLNSTGLDLSQADLIRNYILMGLNYKSQTKIYEKYWIEIENNTTETHSKNNRMSDFIRDYLTFKYSSIPNQNKVFEVFKEKVLYNSEEELIEKLEEIKLYSKFYSLLINPELEQNNLIRENLKLIKKLQINVSYPFLLQVFKCYYNKNINADILIEVLEIIQSYIWRRFICGVATNALNKIFMDLYKVIDEDNFVDSLNRTLVKKSGSQRFPNDIEIMKEIEYKDMYNIQPKNRTYFLERLENYGYKIQNNIENNEEVTIEHIFPQNPSKDWKEALGENFDEMKKYINTASNLTLSAFNRELSNSTFIVKRDLPEKGYRDSPLRMDKLLKDFDSWNLDNIKKRKEWIFQRFMEIWKYTKIEFSEDEIDSEEEINILDIVPSDVKNKSMEFFIFFDVKYSNPSWQLLYKTVSEIMFEREPHMFTSTELSDNLKLSQNKDDLFRPLQISQTYFIESKLSASFIVMRTQKILEKCETDDDLIIKFKNNLNNK